MSTGTHPGPGQPGQPESVPGAGPTTSLPQDGAGAKGTGRGRGVLRWVVPVGAGLLGLVIGVVAGGGDPTASQEYRSLQEDLASVTEQRDEAQDEVSDARETARQALADVAEREIAAFNLEAELQGREDAVAQREAAVTGAEAVVAATQIRNGIWTVGVDIEPGTYRVAEELAGYCYWAILRSGTNGDDIIDNDGPEGGFPVVTLSAGQDFENSCGLWNKQ